MFFRNRWRHFWIVLAVLIGTSFSFQTGYSKEWDSSSDPQAVACVEKFISKFESLKSFNALLLKKEWDLNGKVVHDEKLSFDYQKPNTTILKYLDEGSSGIRNNGMTVTYSGGDEAAITLGKSNVFGFLTRTAASVLIGSKISIFESRMVDGEVFTLNRAGLTYFHQTLKSFLPKILGAKKGGFSLVNHSKCHIKYTPFTEEQVEVHIQPEDSIKKLEEQFGTLAYFIFRDNTGKIDNFEDIFSREKPISLKIKKGFTEYTMDLDPETYLPSKVVLYYNKKPVGEYRYEAYKLNEFENIL